MRIPMKVDYGVRALVDLAHHYGAGTIPTAQIALRQGIPRAYLDRLLTNLNKLGFINSRRGPQGGHALAKDPRDINLGMVMATLEGNGRPLVCLEHPDECALSDNCAQRDIWRSVEKTIYEMLTATTIADLATRRTNRVPVELQKS